MHPMLWLVNTQKFEWYDWVVGGGEGASTFIKSYALLFCRYKSLATYVPCMFKEPAKLISYTSKMGQKVVQVKPY